jgi:tryptophan 2,3-dioxygenase
VQHPRSDEHDEMLFIVIHQVLKVAVAQIDVLETMTPRQLLGFRDRLEAASGFQSAQQLGLPAALTTGSQDDRAYPTRS